MSRIIDFLERMGSEARWRDASPDDMEQALAEAGIDGAMRSAILAKDADAVQALLGRTKQIGMQTPGPVPPAPLPPEPEEEGEEEDDDTGETRQTKDAHEAFNSLPH